MNKKKIIIVVIILGLIATFVAYKMYNKPHVNVFEKSADVIITADKILEDFSSDENTANTKYLEKIIEIKGAISSIKIENEKGIISLQTNDDFGSVLCHFSIESTKKIKEIQKGQDIVVKGICTGYLMDVILVKCEIINK